MIVNAVIREDKIELIIIIIIIFCLIFLFVIYYLTYSRMFKSYEQIIATSYNRR